MKASLFRRLAMVVFFAAGVLFAAPAIAAVDRPAGLRPKLVVLIADGHNDVKNESLPAFATRRLATDFRVVVVTGWMTAGEEHFNRIEELADADMVVVSVTRRAPPKAQLDAIRRYVAAGKPVAGIRTANHAFAISKGQKLPEGGDVWPEWDAEVLGGNYTSILRPNPIVTITAIRPQHPILRGIVLPYIFRSSLYKVSPLHPDAQPLLIGSIPGQAPEPAAWTFTRPGGGRTFYTSLGTPADFLNPDFTEFLRNGILWAAGTLEK